jgi:hypothetical protein
MERGEPSLPDPKTMPEQAEDLIVRNLIEALDRLQDDLVCVELWSAALRCFRHPAPDYQPDNAHLLPTRKQAPR